MIEAPEENFFKKRLNKNNIKLGLIIKMRRAEKKITIKQMANLVGVSQKVIMSWEKGAAMIPAALLPDLCLYLGLNFKDLYNLPDSQYNVQKEQKIQTQKTSLLKHLDSMKKKIILCEDLLNPT